MKTSEKALATIKSPSSGLPVQNKGEVVEVGGKILRFKSAVTRPTLSVKNGWERDLYLRIVSSVTREEDKDGMPIIRNNLAAPYVVAVIDLEDNIEKDFVLPTVLAKKIRNLDNYVGKIFAIHRRPERKGPQGRQYWEFDVAEVEIDQDFGEVD